MQEVLIRRLHEFVRDNHPDLLVTLEQERRVTGFLQESVAAVGNLLDEECSMEELKKQFPPSRFNYLKALIEEEFAIEAETMRRNGIMKTELINLVEACKPVFDEFDFSSENEDDRNLHYAITGAVGEYFNVMSE